MSKSTSDTVLWSLFAAGGVAAAMLMPALIVITGLMLPFADSGVLKLDNPPSWGRLNLLVLSVPVRLLLFGTIFLSLFHCANRLFHTSKDLGIHGARGLVGLICFGGAVAGTVAAAWLTLVP